MWEGMLMRKLVLILALMLLAGNVGAASYQRTDGTVVDPIQCWANCVGDHPYSGNNLEPGVVVAGSYLDFADLADANLQGSEFFTGFVETNLSGANLSQSTFSGVYFTGANVSGANVTLITARNSNWIGADMSGANFSGADLTDSYIEPHSWSGVNFSGSILVNATVTIAIVAGLGLNRGAVFYDANTDFTGASQSQFGQPFDPVAAGWTLVPEPSVAILLGIGLVGLARSSRKRETKALLK